MTINKTESLNIFLLLISLLLAFIFPFELFLFSYAILGPLHYCTEISWLHDKNYFTQHKLSILPLVLLGIIFIISVNFSIISSIAPIIALICICFAFLFSFFIIYDFNIKYSLLSILFIIFVTFVIYQVQILHLIFYYFLVTLIHVYIFTGIFMFTGNIKRHNMLGHIAFIIFLLAPIICFIIPVHTMFIVKYVQINYSLIMHYFITDNFNFFHLALSPDSFFQNELVIKLSRFISFAYTYHYLNWFSKTHIIGWHKTSHIRIIMIFSVWLISIALYAYNYMIGYQILLFLSLLHVFLEFPLNWHSILTLLKIKRH